MSRHRRDLSCPDAGGIFSLRTWVNGNWRVTFRFAGSNVELVDYQDYH
nr:type II toxin-antitoxin system RelE/ParE family toxin [Candidatus Thiosymbion oneisti]